jgi:hypothetical protein
MAPASGLEESLKLDIDELYVALGREAVADSAPALPFRDSKYIDVAKNWFDQNRQRLASAICDAPTIIALRENQRAESQLYLASAILDLIASVVVGVSPVTVSALLAKEGLERLCGNDS